MLVYGDAQRHEQTADLIRRLAGQCIAVRTQPPGIARHSQLAGLLIEAGELTQGLADASMARSGVDTLTDAVRAATRLTFNLATALYRSYLDPGLPVIEPDYSPLAALRGRLPATLTISVPEGYAFYSLYPEMYIPPAERLLAEGHRQTQVISIRSIGVSLGAMVAAVLGKRLPHSVRPGGHPFQRTLNLSGQISRQLLAGSATTHYAIVDEGPGLSGSSFGSVADWLQQRGVSDDQLHFFPSHNADLSIHASERNRSRWATAHKYVPDFDSMLRSGQPSLMRLSEWVSDLTGPAEGELRDIGYGQWRGLLYDDEQAWPGVNRQQERRKYLLTAGGSTWLLKFAGLGRYGEEKLHRAEQLQAAGFISPLRGLRHGFFVQEWLPARPLPLVLDPDRPALLWQVAAYLSHLYQCYPAPHSWQGASPAELLNMARYNSAQHFGPALAQEFDRWQSYLPGLTDSQYRVLTDNKLQAWEWLLLPDGRILKADALDHHASHDLVGAQDLAWDIAGATIELKLTAAEQDDLQAQIARRCGYQVSPQKLTFYTAVYLAFQIGQNQMAADVAGNDLAEAGRLNYARDHYAARLRDLLAAR